MGEGARVCLVSMPYGALTRPSLALGLLKAALERDGVGTSVAYANLWFAEEIGFFRYGLCSAQFPTDLLVGEWTFARAAFPDADPDDDAFLRRIVHAQAVKGGWPHGDDALIEQLEAVRSEAAAFADAAARRVLETGARVVGCTSTFEQHVPSLALLRRVRELDPAVVTMLGGANCETAMGAATHRSFPWVDYVVSGEADGLIAGLCQLALERGRDIDPGELPAGVLGPCHRGPAGPAGRVPPTLARALHRQLDELPVPDFSDYFRALEESPLGAAIDPGLPLETSRGCWWGARHQCTFCGLNGSSMAYRSKSPERVLSEVGELERRHGISRFEVVDNILDMGYFKTVLPRLAEDGKKRSLFYEVKANLGREQVELLRRAGVTWVQPGIESFHTGLLRLMDKGVQGWQNVQLLKWARELGLRISYSLLWGFPGEEDEWFGEMASWMPHLEHLQAPWSLTAVRYDRYSVYHERAEELGLELRPVPSMADIYPVPAADLDGLAYFFVAEEDTGRAWVRSEGAPRLPGRPGVEAVAEALRRWRRAFRAKLRPVLAMEDRDRGLEVIDTRGSARRSRVLLTGLDRAVCLACDDAPPADRLASVLERGHGLHVAADELERAVRRLSDDGFVLELDGRLVTLAVRGSLPELPDALDFPGGYLDQRRYAESRAEALARPVAAGAAT